MFSLIFDTTNAAFEDGNGGANECAAILRAVADSLDGGNTGGRARDTNGNKVGEWRLNDAEGLAEHLDRPAN